MINRPVLCFTLLFLLFAACIPAAGQMITGVWKGKINKQKVEVKIVQRGAPLPALSYYYKPPGHYRRYSIKGYYDAQTNEAVWWDDVLLESKQGRGSLAQPGRVPLLSRADFNCPGDGRMMLDGRAGRPGKERPNGTVDLDKAEEPGFPDEWDYVIDNFLTGTNDPDIIDSISSLALQRMQVPEPQKEIVDKVPVKGKEEMAGPPVKAPVSIQPIETIRPVIEKPVIAAPLTIEQKFTSRQKIFTKEIPLTGDSLELRFYDNAEIDGDSISLFLNDKLIFSHIRLLGTPYTIKLAVSELQDSNELVMVAENLGSIPPNTSYMVAILGDERYEARLESTEGSSAMIRLVKKRE